MMIFFFFFQAEDGIRDKLVTGVQTCALPIFEVDRTGGQWDGNVYFAWARFTGGGSNGFNSSTYLVRSTDHGRTFSSPMKLSQTVHDIQFPDIAVTGNGHVYVTYREFADVRSNTATDAIAYNTSTDCG